MLQHMCFSLLIPNTYIFQPITNEKPPVWFVFSGMGSQWQGMGTQLLKIPIFAKAIEKCDAVLRPKGLDIIHIITSLDSTLFNDILHSFVGISAIQVHNFFWLPIL